MIKTYRFRLYPTKTQETALSATLRLCAELYNAALQERREAWRINRESISYFSQTSQLTDIKKIREDVRGVSALVLENVLKRVDLAFQSFFRRVKRGERAGYPRFRSAARYQSMTFRQIGDAVNGNKLRLAKIGHVRIKMHRALCGSIKTLTVKREAGQWFALFACEVEPQPLPFSANAVGVDVGIKTFATLSDGTTIENPRWFRNAEAKVRRLQRRAARRKKGSNRRRKAVLLLQKLYGHIRDQRRDFHHKESRKLINKNGLVAVEGLNIKGLAGGRLAKSVHDAAWANFMHMLTYKAEEAGRLLVKVDPNGTSQTCTCGAVVRKTLRDRWHLCLNCGLSADRDHVSAQVILGRAERLQALTSPVAECVA